MSATRIFSITRLQRVRGQIREVCVFPAFLHAGERQLHAADVRHNFKAVFAELVAQIAGDAVEQRIAGGQHDDSSVAGFGNFLNGIVQIAADCQPFFADRFRQLP